MKAQDILLLLRLNQLWQQPKPAEMSIRALSDSLGVSKTEVSRAMERCRKNGLIYPERGTGLPKVQTSGLKEFLLHGFRYVFPAEKGALQRGLPTSFAAPGLKQLLQSAGTHIQVWPDAQSADYGESVQPIYPSVPTIARQNSQLYRELALLDSIRLGNARESGIARQALTQALDGVSPDNP